VEKLLVNVSLRRLKSFIEVCKTLHMARAAENMGVAQQALSQQIKGLENALGVRLFNRRKRGIDLTAAGETFRYEAERILSYHEGAIDLVRRTARGEAGRLAIGHVGSVMSERPFSAHLKQFREATPDVEISFREGSIATLFRELKSGLLDIIIVPEPINIEPPFVKKTYAYQKLVAVLPAEHLLAKHANLTISDLANEPMIALPDYDVGIMRVVEKMSQAANVELKIQWRVSSVGSILGLVAAGFGYSILPESLTSLAGNEINVCELSDGNSCTNLCLITHSERETIIIKRFKEMSKLSR